MNLVDLIVIVVVIAYAISGFRNGALSGALSLAGFIGGAVLGAHLARPLGEKLANGQAQVPIAIVCLLVFALLGQLIGVYLAARLRRRITWRPAHSLDSGLGALLSVVGVLVVVCMLAVALASAPFPAVTSEIRRSKVVHGIDTVMPTPVRDVYSSMRSFVDRSGFPEAFGALTPSRIIDVDPPNDALTNSAAVRAVAGSVVKIHAAAPQCDRGIEGSGFVYSSGRVMTNAHVVAGSDSVTVVAGSRSYQARVVVYDPDRDVAVLVVPGLTARSLPFATTPAQTDANAIVLGYPQDGPFDAQAARVRDTQTVGGQDIYVDAGIRRQIYAIRSLVRGGNSGGPLVSPNGRVLGVIFARALDSTDTGFALTAAEVASSATAGRARTAAVATGRCTPND